MMKRLIVLTAAGVLPLLGGCSSGAADDTAVGDIGQRLECSNSDAGVNATKAALAVAMAEEIGELDAVRDLEIRHGKVALKAGACPGECPKTEALLDFQDGFWMSVFPHETFNANRYRRDLKASLRRQIAWEYDLNLNDPGAVPAAHLLVLNSTSDGLCGLDFLFDVYDPGCAPGDPTCAPAAYSGNTENLANRLIVFGGDRNPYLAFQATDTTISIDPDPGDGGDPGGTGGMCEESTLCRVYDPDYERDGCCWCPGLASTGIWERWSRNPYYAICVE